MELPSKSVPVISSENSTTFRPVLVQAVAALAPRGPMTVTSPTPSQVKVPKSTNPLPGGGAAAEAGLAAAANRATAHNDETANAIVRFMLPPCRVLALVVAQS